MSGRDRLTQTRGLLLIHSDGGFTCKKTKNRFFFSHYPACSPFRSSEDRWRELKAVCLRDIDSFLGLFFSLFAIKASRVTFHIGFQSATAEVRWDLLCSEKDEDFGYSAVKIWIVESPIYHIYNIISDKQKICHTPPPLPAPHMQWLPGCNVLIASPFLQWSVILLHPRLTAPPLISRAELFCNICWCGSASKCCRIVLLLELFFFADRRGEEPPQRHRLHAAERHHHLHMQHMCGEKKKKKKKLPLKWVALEFRRKVIFAYLLDSWSNSEYIESV